MYGVLKETGCPPPPFAAPTLNPEEPKEEFSADDYTLAVSLTAASWTKKDTPVPAAVVVRLEDTTGQYAELYARVRASIRARGGVKVFL